MRPLPLALGTLFALTQAFAADIKSDIAKWARVVKAAKIQPE